MARRSAPPPFGFGWIVTWPLTVALAVIVFLCSQELRPSAGPGPGPQKIVGGPDWETHLQERITSLTTALEASSLGLNVTREDPMGAGSLRLTHRTLTAVLREEERTRAEAAIDALRALDPGLSVGSEATFNGTEVEIGLDGLLTHTLQFQWAERPERPQVALVITSLGDDLRIARQIVEIDAPVALGVRPQRPFSKEVADLAGMFKREVLVQLPSERHGDPTEATELRSSIASVPSAVGVLGHDGDDQGSGVGEEVRGHGLFYVSMREQDGGVAVVVPLDGEDGVGLMPNQVEMLLAKARESGYAIGIGRASETTVDGLKAALPQWKAGNIDLVPISALVGPSSLSAR